MPEAAHGAHEATPQPQQQAGTTTVDHAPVPGAADAPRRGWLGRLSDRVRGRRAAPPTPNADHPATTPTPPTPEPQQHTDTATQPEPAPTGNTVVQQQERPSVGPPPKELTIGMVSAHQRIEHQGVNGGRGQEGIQVLEERARELARKMMTENREKWQGRFSGLRNFPERFWKYSIGDVATYNKEKAHAIKLLAESGLQMTNIDYSFFNAVDQAARTRLAPRRSGILGRVRGVSDFFNELTFREGALHNSRLEVMRQLRTAAENPHNNNANVDAALLTQYKSLLTGDFQASEALASKVTTEFGNQLIHATVGEKMAENSVVLEDYVKDAQGNVVLDAQGNPEKNKFTQFFKENVIKRVLAEGLANNGNVSADTLLRTRREIQEFFFSKEFVSWYDLQSPDVRRSLDLSLSYGTDIIPALQEAVLPQILQAREHMSAAGNLETYINEMVLKVQVGTLESGQKGVIEEGILERAASRTITNQRVQELYRQRRQAGNAPRLIPDTYLNAAVGRADLIGSLGRVGSHQILMAGVAGAGLYVGSRMLGRGANLVAPVIGGAVVGGALRGFQEHRLVGRERQQHAVESETGYTFSQDMKRRQQFEGKIYHMREMQTDLVDPMQRLLTELKTNNTLSTDQALHLLGYVADTKARFNIMDTDGVGLLAAQNQQAYQIEKTNLEITQAKAMAGLADLLARDPAKMTEIQQRLRIQNIPNNTDALTFITNQLSMAQQRYIREGVGQNPDYQAALGNLTIAQADSMRARDRSYNWYRGRRVAGAVALGALPAVSYGVSNWALNEGAGYLVNNNIAGAGKLAESLGYAAKAPDLAIGGVTPKDWFDNPQDINLGNGMELRMDPTLVDGGKVFRLHDAATGDVIPGPPMWLQRAADGSTSVVIAGRYDQLSPGLQQMFGADWDHHETDLHNMFAHTKAIAQNGPAKIPDEVIGGANDYKGNFLLNTHDVNQVLNDKGESYDPWAARMNNMDPLTGKLEIGKMSITAPDGTMLNGFTNADGSYEINLKHYGNIDLLKNPTHLSAIEAAMKDEGWDVTKTGDVLHVVPPTATEYIPKDQFAFGHTDLGLPLFWARRPLEQPETVRGATPPRIPRTPQQPDEEIPSGLPPAPTDQTTPPPAPPAPRPDEEDEEPEEPVPAPRPPEEEEVPEEIPPIPEEEIPEAELPEGEDVSDQVTEDVNEGQRQQVEQNSYERVRALGVVVTEDMDSEELLREIQKDHPDWVNDYVHKKIANEAIAHVRVEKTQDQLATIVDEIEGISDQHREYLKRNISPNFLAKINAALERKLISREDTAVVLGTMFSAFSGKSNAQLTAAKQPVPATLQIVLQSLKGRGVKADAVDEVEHVLGNILHEKPELATLLDTTDRQRQGALLRLMIDTYGEERKAREHTENG